MFITVVLKDKEASRKTGNLPPIFLPSGKEFSDKMILRSTVNATDNIKHGATHTI
jgi:hypothetical protein